MTIDSCPWWIRAWHRRLRDHDLRVMWLSLYERADSVDEARIAWEVFVSQDGQWHWRCPCGQPFRLLCQPMIIQIAAEEP